MLFGPVAGAAYVLAGAVIGATTGIAPRRYLAGTALGIVAYAHLGAHAMAPGTTGFAWSVAAAAALAAAGAAPRPPSVARAPTRLAPDGLVPVG
ncbi:MAG TPA: hypothetical protein VFM54_04075 [Micromonosporaceae bacterium]|nr:hypothetical protein [Micromonosporaceae bacterium]